MTKTKKLFVQGPVYHQLESKAKSKGETIRQYVEDLVGAVFFGELL